MIFFQCKPGGVDKPGSHVGPGETFTYNWKVLDGPSSSDPPCIPYLYYSATDPSRDTNTGLVGPLLVCKKGTLGPNGVQVIMEMIHLCFQTCCWCCLAYKCVLIYRGVWIRSSSFFSLWWMKTWAGTWTTIFISLAKIRTSRMKESLKRATKCTVNVESYFGSKYSYQNSLFSDPLHIFLTKPFFLNPFSCERIHVWEPSRTGDVCWGQGCMVHLRAGDGDGHPRCLLWGKYLSETEHNSWHCEPFPPYGCSSQHAPKNSWLVQMR